MAETANRNTSPPERQQQQDKVFVVHLSLFSLILSLAAAVFVAFGLGRLTRLSQQQQQHHQNSSPIVRSLINNNNNNSPPTLPAPVLPAGRKKPHAIYSGRHFDTPGVTSRISDVLLDDSMPQQQQATAFQITPEGLIREMEGRDDDDDDDGGDEEEIHQPRGQHLLVDIKNVDGAFLNSEEQLASAMLNLTKQSELTLLSYHCHGLEPLGVTCVGVLLESHVSFHTWPIPGVITLDLFTCGPKSLIPLISVIEELFAIPQKISNVAASLLSPPLPPPRLIWSHKNRGFDFGGIPSNPENVEHQVFLLGWMEYDMKKRIAMEKTALQTFQVYDVIDKRFNNIETYEKSLSNDGSYESQNPQFFKPERILYLDDVMQSRRHGLEAYHEALVHPAMMAHPHPQRVAIIGGGEGATLREVLKHQTVVTAVMIEIDGAMVKASRQYLPEWSDCSDLVGSTDSCFDDARADVYFEDASGWFLSRFADQDKINEADKFDVIIMDALDPSSMVDFSDTLYSNVALSTAMRNALTDEGVLVSQVGISEVTTEAPWPFTPHGKELGKMVSAFRQVGFAAMKGYQEMHGQFRSPWSFMVAFLNHDSKLFWYANQAQFDLALQARAVSTISGKGPFEYFDGATMMSYQYPSKLAENVFCRDLNAPEHCNTLRGFDPFSPNIPLSSLEIKPSQIPNAGRGVFVKESFPKGTYLVLEAAVDTIWVMPSTYDWASGMANGGVASDLWQSFEPYCHGYGYATDFFSGSAHIVDASLITFINHGCNGTNNVGAKTIVNEMNADLNQMPPGLIDDVVESAFWDPVADRRFETHSGCGDRLLHDVQAGTELLDNYLGLLDLETWSSGVTDFRAQCIGQSLGMVSSYEQGQI